MVPLIDLRRRHAALAREFHAASARVLASGHLLLGPELEALESELTAWSSQRHAVGVGSGTDALRLTMTALGIGPGDEVLVPAFTAVPTAAAVCAIGATPVPVDVESATGAIEASAARAAVGPRTKALVAVHLYGRPTPLAELAALGLPIIEDAAQAHGALTGARPSVAVAYSFYPTKNLGGIGDGGAVCTDDADLAARIRRLRHHGMRELYVHTDIATNSRLSEIEAAWLRLCLPLLAAWNARRREIATRYRAAGPSLRWHPDHPQHVHHLVVVRVPDRAVFRERLAGAVATGVHYPRSIPEQPAYARFARAPCPEAAAWARECVSLPCFAELTDAEVDAVCEALACHR